VMMVMVQEVRLREVHSVPLQQTFDPEHCELSESSVLDSERTTAVRGLAWLKHS
jgi:hypothetical protein